MTSKQLLVVLIKSSSVHAGRRCHCVHIIFASRSFKCVGFLLVLVPHVQRLISKLKLKEQVGAEHQTYGLGVKEVWKVLPEKHREGHVEHMIGYPLDAWTYGGGFLYHMSDERVALGFVVGLDYWNTYLSPFHEFQKFKAHPYVRRILEGGTCLEYGARALNEGVSCQPQRELALTGGVCYCCACIALATNCHALLHKLFG